MQKFRPEVGKGLNNLVTSVNWDPIVSFSEWRCFLHTLIFNFKLGESNGGTDG